MTYFAEIDGQITMNVHDNDAFERIFLFSFLLLAFSNATNLSYVETMIPHFKSCLGSPFLYVTFHDKFPNIFKFSRNGCLLQTDVLKGGPLIKKRKHKQTELR